MAGKRQKVIANRDGRMCKVRVKEKKKRKKKRYQYFISGSSLAATRGLVMVMYQKAGRTRIEMLDCRSVCECGCAEYVMWTDECECMEAIRLQESGVTVHDHENVQTRQDDFA